MDMCIFDHLKIVVVTLEVVVNYILWMDKEL